MSPCFAFTPIPDGRVKTNRAAPCMWHKRTMAFLHASASSLNLVNPVTRDQSSCRQRGDQPCEQSAGWCCSQRLRLGPARVQEQNATHLYAEWKAPGGTFDNRTRIRVYTKRMIHLEEAGSNSAMLTGQATGASQAQICASLPTRKNAASNDTRFNSFLEGMVTCSENVAFDICLRGFPFGSQ